MRRQMNWKFLIILVTSTGLFSLCVYFVHGYQFSRNAGAYLDQAERARISGDLWQAADYYDRYLAFHPDDIEVRVKFGKVFDEHGQRDQSVPQFARAYRIYDQVLRLDANRVDIRRRCIELAMVELRRFTDAKPHLEALRETAPHDADILFKLGECEEGNREYVKARDWFAQAVDRAPNEIKYYTRLANLYMQALEQPNRARETLAKMIEKNPRSFRAHLEHARLLIEQSARDKKLLKDAVAALEQARQLAPKEADIILVSARLAQAQNKEDEARAFLTAGLAAHPKNAGMYLAMVQLEARAKRLGQAQEFARRGVAALPESKDLWYMLGELCIEKGELAEAEKITEKLAAIKFVPPLVDYLQARIHIGRAQWADAERLLTRVRPMLLDRTSLLLGHIDFLLGLCFERLGTADQALTVYQEAVKINPLSIEARLRVAATFVGLDRLEEAVNEYRQILALERAPAAVHLALARILIQQNMRAAEKARSWDEVHQHLVLAGKRMPDSVEVPILRAEVMLLENAKNRDAVRRYLDQQRARRPDEIGYWLALAALDGREDATKALAVLAQAQKVDRLTFWKENRLALSQARLNYWSRLPEAEAKKVLAEFEQSLPEDEFAETLRGNLARAYLRIGERDKAVQLWRVVAKEQPQNLALRILLCDLALLDGRGDEADQLAADIRKIEGEPGSFWRYAKAARLAQQAFPRNKEALSPQARQNLMQARKLLDEALKRRPSWSNALALLGQIDDMEGRPDRAISSFQQAVQVGERRPSVVRRLVELLFERSRFVDAEKAIRKLLDQEQTLLTAGLGKLAAHSLLRAQENERAVELALRSVSADSKSHKDHLWLGQILWVVGKKAEAKKELLRAVELEPAVSETWKALIFFLIATDEKKEAEATLARAKEKLPAADVPLTLAHCHTLLGNLEEAEKNYLIAVGSRSTDLSIQAQLAGFYKLTGQLAKAEPILQQLLAASASTSPEQKAAARRDLAWILATTKNDYRQFQKGLALLDENRRVKGGETTDQLMRAKLLATHVKHRREAIFLYEDVNRNQPLTPDERFALAMLYALEKNKLKLQLHMLTLLQAAEGKRPEFIAFYARHLVREGDLAEAQAWLRELTAHAPKAFVTAEIRARLLRAEGKDAEAAAVLKAYAQEKDGILPAALIADEFDRDKGQEVYRQTAEQLYRQYVAQAQKERFRAHLALAQFLGTRQRVAEALDQCEQALADGKPEVVISRAIAVLRSNQAPAESIQRVENWLTKAQKAAANPVPLWVARADLLDLQGQYVEAISIYRQVLARDPGHLVAMNNLAWLLALTQRSAESLDWIQKALNITGPNPELLDTRGIVLLTLNRTKEALSDLEHAVELGGTPAIYFHLARAQLQAQNRAGAVHAFARARTDGLSHDLIHPLERGELQRLQTAFEPKN